MPAPVLAAALATRTGRRFAHRLAGAGVAFALIIGLAVSTLIVGGGIPDADAACLDPAGAQQAGVDLGAAGQGSQLDAEALGYARVIAERGIKAGVGTQGVVIALATAMQESTMRNLDFGDRDSLGLFQQRPSTGWGTPEEIRDPVKAADAFYGVASHTRNTGLRQIPGWQQMSVTEAAQAVQRSAFPDAYAQWEGMARQLAEQLVGDVAVTAPSGDAAGSPDGVTGSCTIGASVAVSGDWAAPLASLVPTSPFGMRRHPITGVYKLHTGQDFAAPTGTPIMAACTGRVSFAGTTAAGGNETRLDCGGGITIVLMHQSRIDVDQGQPVTAGTQVGAVGSTGYSTGPHLHFEVLVGATPTDPIPFMSERGIAL